MSWNQLQVLTQKPFGAGSGQWRFFPIELPPRGDAMNPDLRDVGTPSLTRRQVTRVTSHLLGPQAILYFRAKIEHEIRSPFACVAPRLLVLCADCFFDNSGREKMLCGLGDSGGQQPDHLCHRAKNRTTGLHSGEPVLYCALRSQPSNVAQGQVLLSRAARRFAATSQETVIAS